MEFESKVRSFGGEQRDFVHPSEAVGLPMRGSVYLPPAALAGEPCPVVYFLSGLTCTAANFVTKAGAQRVASELGLIIVAPDTSPRGAGTEGEDDAWDFGTGAGFYVDATVAPWSRHYRMWSYVTQELPDCVEATFPVRVGARGVCGHSMGGHGALVAALRHPERYRSVSALAPIVAPASVPWGQKAFAGYLGQDQAAWRDYDATELVEMGARHPTEILIDQGLSDGFLAAQLQPERFERACAGHGQPLRYRAHPGYDHSYFFIATFIEDHLRHHHAALRASAT
ncbi:MAG: S-formylglutathione hydrolase [Myxococcota bacterium]